jgi:ferrous iron transport protein A
MSDSNHISLAELKKGDKAVIHRLTDDAASQILMEMGCLPGEQITVARVAPLGDPMSIKINGSVISLRKSEAKGVQVIFQR